MVCCERLINTPVPEINKRAGTQQLCVCERASEPLCKSDWSHTPSLANAWHAPHLCSRRKSKLGDEKTFRTLGSSQAKCNFNTRSNSICWPAASSTQTVRPGVCYATTQSKLYSLDCVCVYRNMTTRTHNNNTTTAHQQSHTPVIPTRESDAHYIGAGCLSCLSWVAYKAPEQCQMVVNWKQQKSQRENDWNLFYTGGYFNFKRLNCYMALSTF